MYHHKANVTHSPKDSHYYDTICTVLHHEVNVLHSPKDLRQCDKICTVHHYGVNIFHSPKDSHNCDKICTVNLHHHDVNVLHSPKDSSSNKGRGPPERNWSCDMTGKHSNPPKHLFTVKMMIGLDC